MSKVVNRLALFALVLSIAVVVATARTFADAARPAASVIAPAPLSAAKPQAAGKARAQISYAKLPLSFERNRGQTDARVKFISRGRGYALFLTDDGATLTLQEPSKRAAAASRLSRTEPARYATLRVKLDGADHRASVSGEQQLPGRVNYFIGNDPSKWRKDVPTYVAGEIRSVYPGVDVVYHGSTQRLLEYDFQVSPGADPSRIGSASTGQSRSGSTSTAI